MISAIMLIITYQKWAIRGYKKVGDSWNAYLHLAVSSANEKPTLEWGHNAAHQESDGCPRLHCNLEFYFVWNRVKI